MMGVSTLRRSFMSLPSADINDGHLIVRSLNLGMFKSSKTISAYNLYTPQDEDQECMRIHHLNAVDVALTDMHEPSARC